MGYPEEESDNKKVEAKDIFLNEFEKKREEVNKVTCNEDIHSENFKTNGGCQHSDPNDRNQSNGTLLSADELNSLITNPAFEKINCDIKSCFPLSKTVPVAREECSYSFNTNGNSPSHLADDEINNDMYSNESNNFDERNCDTENLIDQVLVTPNCDIKSDDADSPPKDGENKLCTDLTNDLNTRLNSSSSQQNPCLLTSVAKLTEKSEDKDEDSDWPCFKISNIVSLKESKNVQRCRAETASYQNINIIQGDKSEQSSNTADSKKSSISYEDAFLSFVSTEMPKSIPNEIKAGNNDFENERVIKANFKNCKQKYSSKKFFNSKEIAMMKGFSCRCNSISLFNGKFLTRRNFSADHIKIDKLELPLKKQKIVRKQVKRGRGRPRKIFNLVEGKSKPRNKVQNLSISFCEISDAKNSGALGKSIKKKVAQPDKNVKSLTAIQKKVKGNLPNTSINKEFENYKESVSSIDDLSSGLMNIKDSEKLYSQLIEEAITSDIDDTSEKSLIPSDNELLESQGLWSKTDRSMGEDAVKTSLQNYKFSSKTVLQRHMSVRRRSPSRSNAINDVEVEDQCCGHWFPTRKSFINHLIEMEADLNHTAKLLDNEMVKCQVCPTWTTAHGEKKHLRDCHNIKCSAPKNISMAAPLTAKASSRCIGGTNSKFVRNVTENEPDIDGVENSEYRPCPMSRKVHTPTINSKKIICNLTNDPMASDSVIKIASVSELPKYLKPVIQLSLKENIDTPRSFNSSFVNDLTGTLNLPLKSLSGNGKSVNLENFKHRKFLKNKSENNVNPITNGSQHSENKKHTFSAKAENSLNISKGSRFNYENIGSLKKRMRRRRRSSRRSLDSSPDRYVGVDSLSRIKFKSSKLKRNRTLRRNGRKIRRCGFHSSETSDGTSSQSDSESSEIHESEYLDYDDVNNNIENIPTVELDLFTIDSFNEEPSVFLTDPTNPDFKVFASMDAIFVGDSALGDVTNQVGYITDVNNVVFVNPSHFLFPKIDDKEFSNKRGNSKMKLSVCAQTRPLRKVIKPLKEDLQNVKDSNSNSRALKLNENILAITTENIKGYDKENLSSIDNNTNSKCKVTTIQLGDIARKPISSNFTKDTAFTGEFAKISSTSAGDLPNNILPIKPHFEDLLPLIENSAPKPFGQSSVQSYELHSPKLTKSTIIVRSDNSKRKIVLKNAFNKVTPLNQNVVVIKTSTNKVTSSQEMSRFVDQNIQKLSDVNAGTKIVASANAEHDHLNESKTLSKLKSVTEEDVFTLKNTSFGKLDRSFGLTNADFMPTMKRAIAKSDITSLDKELLDSFDSNQCLEESFSSCLENAATDKNVDLGKDLLENAIPSIDELISKKEFDATLFLKSRNKFDCRRDNYDEMNKLTYTNSYQKDDIISLDDAIAALAPCESDKIEECFFSNKKNDIDNVDIADFDDIAISSTHESTSNFTLLEPKGNVDNVQNTLDDEFNRPTPFPNSISSQPVSHLLDSKIEYEPKQENFTSNKLLATQSLPQIEVVVDSQVVVTSAEITPFETLEGGVCLEDVLENDAEDFDILSMNGFVSKKQNTEAEMQPAAPKMELCSVTKLATENTPSTSTEFNMQTLSPPSIDCPPDKEYTKDNSFSMLTESFLNSSFDDLDSYQEPVPSPSSKFSNSVSIADIVKGKSLWDTPLLCSPIKPNLNETIIPPAPKTPSRQFSRMKLDQLLDVPLSSIPDLLSPSRELAEGFMENGPVELSPNTVSSILSPNIYRKNSNLLSPIVNSTGIQQIAESPSNLHGTPHKTFKAKKKSAKKNILNSPLSHEFDAGVHMKGEPRLGLNQNSKYISSTPKTENIPNLNKNHRKEDNDLNNELVIDRLSVKNCSTKLSLNDTLSPSKSSPLNNSDLLSNNISNSNTFTPKSASFQSSSPNSSSQLPPKIGFLVNNSPLYKSSEKEPSNYFSHNSSSSDASMDMSSIRSPGNSSAKFPHERFPGFQPSDPSPSKASLETFSGLLCRNVPLNTSNSSIDESEYKHISSNSSLALKSPKIKPSFEGFNSSYSTKLPEHGNSSLKMKISLKGFNHSKSEASFNSISDSSCTDEDDDNRNNSNCKNKSALSSSSSNSASSSSGSSSSSSSDSEESTDENPDESKKIVLTQFDSVSGRRKKSPSKKREGVSPPASLQAKDVAKINLGNNVDLTSLKITVRESEIEKSKYATTTDCSFKDANIESPIIVSNKQLNLPNLIKDDKTADHHSDHSKQMGIAGQDIKEDRIWHSRDAKLKAQVMISDHQKGISDTSVDSTHFKELESPNTALSKKIVRSDAVSSIGADKLENLSNLRGKKSENKDIRSYFSQLPLENHTKSSSSYPEPKETKMYTPYTLSSKTTKRSRNRKISYSKATKRRRSEDNIDIRNFLSPQELKATQSGDVDLNPSKKFCMDDGIKKYSNRSIKKNHGKLHASSIQQKYEEIVHNSLNNSDDILTLRDLNFEGFEKPSRVSSIRSKILLEYSDVLKMTWWFVTDRYPLPVDQICDWDEDQLNSILFENG